MKGKATKEEWDAHHAHMADLKEKVAAHRKARGEARDPSLGRTLPERTRQMARRVTYTERPKDQGPRVEFSRARMAAVRAERDRRIAEGRVEPDGVRRADTEEGGV